MPDSSSTTIKKIFCNICNIETNHELKESHTRKVSYYEDNGPRFSSEIYWQEWEYKFWICRGCDTALLEEIYTDPSMNDLEMGGQFFDIQVFPKPSFRVRIPKHFLHIDSKLKNTYHDVISSFNAGAEISCAMTLRALLEGVCVDKGVGDNVARGLEGKLEKLKDRNILAPNIIDTLLSLKFIGDDAAHRLEAPRDGELKLAIDVIEDLLNFLYEAEYSLTKRAESLANGRSNEIAALKNKRLNSKKK